MAGMSSGGRVPHDEVLGWFISGMADAVPTAGRLAGCGLHPPEEVPFS